MTCARCGSELGRRASACTECSALVRVPQLQHLQQTVELTGIVAMSRGRFDKDAPAPTVAELAVAGASGSAIAPPSPVSRPVAQWHLVTPDGTRHPIRSGTVIGRAPMQTAGRPRYDLLTLTDATKSLSKTHALLEPHGYYCTVENLGATNGVLVRSADGSERHARVGTPMPLEPGAVLQLGGFLAGVIRD